MQIVKILQGSQSKNQNGVTKTKNYEVGMLDDNNTNIENEDQLNENKMSDNHNSNQSNNYYELENKNNFALNDLNESKHLENNNHYHNIHVSNNPYGLTTATDLSNYSDVNPNYTTGPTFNAFQNKNYENQSDMQNYTSEPNYGFIFQNNESDANNTSWQSSGYGFNKFL